VGNGKEYQRLKEYIVQGEVTKFSTVPEGFLLKNSKFEKEEGENMNGKSPMSKS